MKKLLTVLLAAVLVFAFAACSGSSGSKDADPAVGHWVHTYSQTDNGEMHKMGGDGNYKFTFDIEADGTFTNVLTDSNGVTGNYEGTWTVENGTYTLKFKSGSEDIILTLEDGKLVMKTYSGSIYYFEKNVN